MSPMPDRPSTLVTNTTPLIALTAAMGDLDVLRFLYQRVVVPLEVAQEIYVGGKRAFGVSVFAQAEWLDVQTRPVVLPPFLQNSLDVGEAAAIQTALSLSLPLVCIDEVVGRRVARLCGLTVTGTVGLLLKAQQLGYQLSMPNAIARMQEHGIWLSSAVVQFALAQRH